MSTDEVVSVTTIACLILTSMRMLYGSWPWETWKHWPRTSQHIEWLQKMVNHYKVGSSYDDDPHDVVTTSPHFTLIRETPNEAIGDGRLHGHRDGGETGNQTS